MLIHKKALLSCINTASCDPPYDITNNTCFNVNSERDAISFSGKGRRWKSGAVSLALKTPLINWSAPTYQKTVIVLIALNVICLICGCLYEVFGRK